MSGPLDCEATACGEQTLIPGVRPVTLRERLALAQGQPLQPVKPQKPPTIGLFDGEADQKKVQWTFFPPNARNQLSLF